MRQLLYTLLFLFAAAAQAQIISYNFEEAEAKSRRLIYKMPDSALIIIKKTLSQQGKLHDTIQGNTYNLYGLYYNQKGRQDSAIHYYNKAIGYTNDFPKIKIRILINTCMAYRSKGEYTTSIKYANEALELSKKAKFNRGIAMAYGELASNYNYMLDYNKSVDYLLKAIAIAKQESRPLGTLKQKLANTYMQMENYTFAKDLYIESLAEFKAMGNYKNYYLTHTNLAEALLRLKDVSGAKASLKEAVTGLEKFGDNELIGITYSKIGSTEQLQAHYPQAIAAYQKAVDRLLTVQSARIIRVAGDYIGLLTIGKDYKKALEVINITEKHMDPDKANLEDRMVYRKAAAEVYANTGNTTKAVPAYNEAITLMDSLKSIEKKGEVQELQAKFQTDLQREKNIALEGHNKILKESASTDKWIMILYIIISIIVMVMIVSLLRSYRLKNKLQNIELKNIETEKNLIKQQHMHEQELNNAQREIIEEKQRELTSLVLKMANYQDSLNDVIDKVETSVLTKAGDVKKELQHIIKQKDYWKQFETKFNNLHPEFNNNMVQRFSKLTKNDIEFCSLLKLNLSNKEIASLLQISHESAITKKYRIKKKMAVNDDAEFEKILMEI